MVTSNETSILAGIGLVAIFLGLYIIWPALAIITVGGVVLSTAVGMAILRRRAATSSERDG